MTVWVMHLALTPEEEATIEQRSSIILPFEDLPDLTPVHNEGQFLILLQTLHPLMPPESLMRSAHEGWQFFGQVSPEDILAIPLQASAKLALAEVTGKYHFTIGEDHESIHSLPVKWYPKRIALSRFRKNRDAFAFVGGRRVYELTQAEPRLIIRESLPHSYNRFVKFKWILGLFFVWRLVMYMLQMFPHESLYHVH